jgi:hypothetical protein
MEIQEDQQVLIIGVVVAVVPAQLANLVVRGRPRLAEEETEYKFL